MEEAPDSVLFKESLHGFDRGIGVRTAISFLEWVLLSRGQSDGQMFTGAGEDCPNKIFIQDVQTVFYSERVSGLIVLLGSSLATPVEAYYLDFDPNQQEPDSSKQMLGSKVIQKLGSIQLPNLAKGVGIRILLRVCRDSKNRIGTDGFSVVDEDIDFLSSTSCVFIWNTRACDMNNDNRYCYLLWTRSRLVYT